MLKKLFDFAVAKPLVAAVIAGILIVCIYFAFKSLEGSWHDHEINSKDAQIQKSIDASEKSAEVSETNANNDRDARQEAEGRAQLAEQERREAADNASRTIDPVRKARQRYDQARHARPANAPELSDEELCAELAKRQISCR